MKNIDYLELFFKKHNLSGRITVKYTSPEVDDDYMSDIVFENGDTINIKDVIFDIDSEFPDDVAEMWMKAKKENDISLAEWIQTDIKYIPKFMDTSSVQAYQQEMTDLFDGVKQTIQSIFELEIDDGDSDSDEDIESGE